MASSSSDGSRHESYINVLSNAEVQDFSREHQIDGTDAKFLIDWAAAVNDVTKHPRVVALVEAATKGENAVGAATAVKNKAAAIAREMGAMLSRRLVSATYVVTHTMMKRLYTGVICERGQLAAFAELCKRAHVQGRSVIFLPSHKSHIDYIVACFVVNSFGLGSPAIAAGDNLNIFLLGKFLRRNGAFFIRRSFTGPDSELYTAVVAAYVEGLMRRGANLKFFLEGGRSRTGKLLEPKIGMLGMLLEPILAGTVDDAYIVPISIYYDKVMEARTYVTELLGSKKRKENLFDVVGQAQHLLAMRRSRYGNIHIRIAPGFSAKEYAETQVALQRHIGIRPSFDPRISTGDREVLLKALAYHVLYEINRVSSVTPTALVGTALLCTLGRGIGRFDLIRKVDWLQKVVVRSGGHLSALHGFSSDLAADVVDSAISVLGSLVQIVTGLLEPVYVIAPDKHFELSYYRNMCVHVFVHQAIIAAVLHRFIRRQPYAEHVPREEVMHDVRFLSKLLKYEFVFSGSAAQPRSPYKNAQSPPPTDFGAELQNTALMVNFESALELMASEGVVEVDENKVVIVSEQMHPALRNRCYEPSNTHFHFLGSFVWPVIESYWLVLAGLRFMFHNGFTTIGEVDTLRRLLGFARTLVHLGRVHYYEGASDEALRKALQTYLEMGVVRRVVATDDEGVRKATLRLGAEYTGHDGMSRLSQLANEVASYRRGWREQEGIEEYPDYIARLAFGAAKL